MNRKTFRFFRYLGPGVLVTVGFIDPGNWAANIGAGSEFGYTLLWMVTLSTLMLIILQHNVAHLGIATGKCLAENSFIHLKPKYNIMVLSTGFMASISTALAEILGGAIALDMLADIPLLIGAIILSVTVLLVTFLTNYRRLEKIIISFVAIISFCFLYELSLIDVDWVGAATSSIKPHIPQGSLLIIVSVLGAVVMPHNLFLHSEIIQSRKWFNKNAKIKRHLMRFEFFDTLISMIIGWAINSTIIILAVEIFFNNNIQVSELSQASKLLEPILGSKAAAVFAVSLLFAGFASSITAGVSGGIIFSGLFNKEYDHNGKYAKIGALLTLVIATFVILFISNPLQGLLYSQMFLSMQLPITIGLQIYLTSSKKVMGRDANGLFTNSVLIVCGVIVAFLNILLLLSEFKLISL